MNKLRHRDRDTSLEVQRRWQRRRYWRVHRANDAMDLAVAEALGFLRRLLGR